MGVTGGSYGGFATAWCSTYHSERFAAGVMFAGVSNHISKAGTTDIPEEMYLVHARKRIWEDWKFFLKQSPVYYVKQARTPLLILGGENDMGKVMNKTPHLNLTVIPSGPIPPNPSELLGSERMGKILSLLADRYDRVILDCTPLIAVTDATIVAGAP